MVFLLKLNDKLANCNVINILDSIMRYEILGTGFLFCICHN